jgi:hypothetical protein
MKVVLVCGGRHYDNFKQFDAVMDFLHIRNKFVRVIHGGASGADNAAHFWAGYNRIPVDVYEAHWNRHGNAAGILRNQRMLDEGKPDLVVAFPGGAGTADMVRRARRAGLPVYEVQPAGTTLRSTSESPPVPAA